MFLDSLQTTVYLLAVLGILLINVHSYTHVNEANLETLLKGHFNDFRRHDINITAKYVVRDFIAQRFEEYGLEVILHGFPTRKPEFTGTNVIGILNGHLAMTSSDKVVLLGSHYDTADSTPGVDDNGSGMALLMESARVVTSHCKPEYTIIFVAFDYAEYTISWAGDPCYWDVPCGSQRFVEDWLGEFLRNRGYPEFQGAFIADTLMNWDNSENSQDLPGAFNVLFDGAYTRIEDNDFRGDFLFVYSRPEDANLMEIFTSQYNAQDDSSYRIECLTLPIAGQPNYNEKRFYAAQLRSDHHNFWRNSDSFKAIQLTDSANFRGDMQSCHHRMCDNITTLSSAKISFLAKTTKAIVKTLLEMSATSDYCPDEAGHSESLSTDIISSFGPSKEPTPVEIPSDPGSSRKTTKTPLLSNPERVSNHARMLSFSAMLTLLQAAVAMAITSVHIVR